MSNVSYDLDTSGGLMPLIRALVKPPDEEANGSKKKTQHPYYKRPGKGHNHDSCDACEEGGDLICCDRCPASFHFHCHDPPLDKHEIPEGQWLCKVCRMSNVSTSPGTTRSGSRATSPSQSSDGDKKGRTLRNRGTGATPATKKTEAKTAKGKESDKDNMPEPPKKPSSKIHSSMEQLVKAAQIMNPKQFELPREMRRFFPFPGTDKEGPEAEKNGSGPAVVTTDSYGCVPLPAKTCFNCGDTCKVAPLIQCDYCVLLFHQDCLDPPLTALPSGRWMCPNHVEQAIDWLLVNSVSATERAALWDKFTGPIDQHAIKIDFIRQVRKAKPPFRMKLPVGVRGRVCVPEMVRYHYENPPPLLPSRREYVRCKKVLKNLKLNDILPSPGPKHVICMNLDCPMYLTANGVCGHERDELDSEDEAAEDVRLIEEAVKRTGGDVEESSSPTKRRKSQSDDAAEERKPLLPMRAEPAEAQDVLEFADRQLKCLDENLVKLLAFQRLQQVLAGELRTRPWSNAPLDAKAEEIVKRSVDRGKLARFGFRHVPLPSELLTRAETERIARAVWGEPPREPRAGDEAPAARDCDASVIATLLPIERGPRESLGDSIGRPIPMRMSRLTMGRGSSCDVPLARYSDCRYLSPLHAIIFYDEVSRHFELMNYSEYGTRVDGALYSCDLTARRPTDDSESKAQAVRDIVQRHAVRVVRKDGEELKPECLCPPAERRPLVAGWEGAAVLQHGALLQMGCVMLVFCITDAIPAQS